MSTVLVTNANFDSLGVLATNTTYLVTENINITSPFTGYTVTNANVTFDFNNKTVTIVDYPLFPGLFLAQTVAQTFTVKNLNLVASGTTDLNTHQGFIFRAESYNFFCQDCNLTLDNLVTSSTGAGILGRNNTTFPNNSLIDITRCNVDVKGASANALIIGESINFGAVDSLVTVSFCNCKVNNGSNISLIGSFANETAVSTLPYSLIVSDCTLLITNSDNCTGIVGQFANYQAHDCNIQITRCTATIYNNLLKGGILGNISNDSITSSLINISYCTVNVGGNIDFGGGGIAGINTNGGANSTSGNKTLSISYCSINVNGSILNGSGGIIGEGLNFSCTTSTLTRIISCYVNVAGNITTGSGGFLGQNVNINTLSSTTIIISNSNINIEGNIDTNSGGIIGIYANNNSTGLLLSVSKIIGVNNTYVIVRGSVLNGSGGVVGSNANIIPTPPAQLLFNIIGLDYTYVIIFGKNGVGIDNTSGGMFGNNSNDGVNTDVSVIQSISILESYVAAYGDVSNPIDYSFFSSSNVSPASTTNINNVYSNVPQVTTANFSFITFTLTGFSSPLVTTWAPGVYSYSTPDKFRNGGYYFPMLSVFMDSPWYNYCTASYQATFYLIPGLCSSLNKANINNSCVYNVNTLDEIINRCSYPLVCGGPLEKKCGAITLDGIIKRQVKLNNKQQSKSCCNK